MDIREPRFVTDFSKVSSSVTLSHGIKRLKDIASYYRNTEGVDPEALGKYMSEYDYLGREKQEIIQEAVRKKKMGLLARSAAVRRIVEKMREIIELFNWE